jgi:hypothetical protein
LVSLSVLVKDDESRTRLTRSPSIGLHHDLLRDLDVDIPSIVRFAVGTFLKLIQNLRGLHNLTIRISSMPEDPVDGDKIPISPVIHLGIHSLTLSELGILALEHLTLPNLRQLAVQDLVPSQDAVDALIPFFVRSKCQLTNFRVQVRLQAPYFKKDWWRRFWAPLCQTMGLEETLIREDSKVYGVIEGAWNRKDTTKTRTAQR